LESEIRNLFDDLGNLKHFNLVKKRDECGNINTLYAFVSFENRDDMLSGLRLHNYVIHGRPLVVREADRKPNVTRERFQNRNHTSDEDTLFPKLYLDI
jgi:RNA recognition motif-containing protein